MPACAPAKLVRPQGRRRRRPTPPPSATCWPARQAPFRDIVLLNAAAALIVGGKADEPARRRRLAAPVPSTAAGAAQARRSTISFGSRVTNEDVPEHVDGRHPRQDHRLQARGSRRRQGREARCSVMAEYARSARRACVRSRTPSKREARQGRAGADRRDQEGVAVEGPDPRRLRSARAGARPTRRRGAACLSVLTDDALVPGRARVPRPRRARPCTLPVLRKDFMIDTYQVAEARAWGADCILIILAEVDDAPRRAISRARRSDWGMDAIVEVHDDAELDRALTLDCRLIGINNRNLKTFETTLATTERARSRGCRRTASSSARAASSRRPTSRACPRWASTRSSSAKA